MICPEKFKYDTRKKISKRIQSSPQTDSIFSCYASAHNYTYFTSLFNYFFYCSCPNFFPLTPSSPQLILSQLSMSIHHSYMSFDLSLPLPSTMLPPSSPPTAISLFHVSLPTVLFFSLVYCVH